MQCLVVDDESATRRVVGYALKLDGIEVIGAEDGAQAIALASQNEYAFMIVDINLPDIDGFEVVRRIKQFPHMADIPTVIFTARSDPADTVRAAEVGAVGFLYKPFSTQELRDLIKKLLVG